MPISAEHPLYKKAVAGILVLKVPLAQLERSFADIRGGTLIPKRARTA